MRNQGSLGCTKYYAPKIHRKRIVNHHRHGFTSLLHNWLALITCISNALSRDCRSQPKKKAKIRYLLDKWEDCCFQGQVAHYLYVLESIQPLTLIFEKKNLILFEVNHSVGGTLCSLLEMQEGNLNETNPSILHNFSIIRGCDVQTCFEVYKKAGHKR